MKKIGIILFFIFVMLQSQTLAEESITPNNENEHSFAASIIQKTLEEEPILITENTQNPVDDSFIQQPQRSGIINYDPTQGAASQQFFLFNAIKQTAKDVYNLEIERTDIPSALLKDQLTHHFEKGPLDNIHVWSAIQMNFSSDFKEKGNYDSKFDVGLINIIIDGQFKGKKENFRIMLDPTHRHTHPDFMQPFFQDLYIESKRIPHTSILVGNSRPGVGIEGAQSPYTLAFANRSQISRNLANIRKFGLRVRGDYSLMDYDMGIYSSSTNFTSFFPGHEFDAWMNIKPLGKTNGKYGKLVTGGGLQSGEKHGTNYFLSGAYAGYEYKKFWTKFEYARANGSNGGSGLTNKHSQGLFVTTGYHLTKKLELLARFDQFDPDRTIKNNNQREYTAGINYYIKGQALKLILNYIYCQNDSKPDSHKILLGTQIVL